MTQNEFLSIIKSHGGAIGAAADATTVQLANVHLTQMRAAMLAPFIRELYATTGGIQLGCAAIFGPAECAMGAGYPLPSIVDINHAIASIDDMRGKTVFARNNLFWFAFDAFGVCYMLDNLTLRPLRKYDDPYRAMTDCMAVGQL